MKAAGSVANTISKDDSNLLTEVLSDNGFISHSRLEISDYFQGPKPSQSMAIDNQYLSIQENTYETQEIMCASMCASCKKIEDLLKVCQMKNIPRVGGFSRILFFRHRWIKFFK